MTDFYTDNLVLQIAEIKDDLYARLKEARSKANEPFPD